MCLVTNNFSWWRGQKADDYYAVTFSCRSEGGMLGWVKLSCGDEKDGEGLRGGVPGLYSQWSRHSLLLRKRLLEITSFSEHFRYFIPYCRNLEPLLLILKDLHILSAYTVTRRSYDGSTASLEVMLMALSTNKGNLISRVSPLASPTPTS